MMGLIILVVKWLDSLSYIKNMHHRIWFWNLLAWAREGKPQSPGTVLLYFWICKMKIISIKKIQ